MKDIFFYQNIVNSTKNVINLEFSKKITKKERLFLKLLFFKIISNSKSLNKLEIESNEVISIIELSDDELNNFLKKLLEKQIIFNISTTNKNYSGIFSIISSFILCDNTCEIFFTEEFKSCFSTKKSIFSILEIEKFIFMEDSFSFNLYNNIVKSSNEDQREFDLYISSLKEYLNSANKYSRFFDFEKYILKKAVSDINTFTNFNVTYKKIKAGRKLSNKIVAINFKISKSKKIPILYEDSIYKMIELVKDRVENIEKIYALFLAYSRKKGHKYIYDNIEYLKNSSHNNFDKKLRKALLLNLAANKLKLYVNINESVSSPSILLEKVMKYLNKIRSFYPKIGILQYKSTSDDLRSIRFFKDNDEFEYKNEDMEIYVKYFLNKKSVIKIYLPDNVIKKLKNN